MLFFLSIFPRFGSRSGMAQYARSEAELEQIMDGLHEQEVIWYLVTELDIIRAASAGLTGSVRQYKCG